MMKIIVGSTNPVKITSTKAAFETAFPEEEFEVEGVSVVSEVRDQPLSNDETLLGARNRAKNAKATGSAELKAKAISAKLSSKSETSCMIPQCSSRFR